MDYRTYTLDMFMLEPGEKIELKSRLIDKWVNDLIDRGIYSFECPRQGSQGPAVDLYHEGLKDISVLNFSSYNYLGFANHPVVNSFAKDAIDKYGTSSSGSPIINGKTKIFSELEFELVDFFGLEGKSVAIYPSGYSTNSGAIQALIGDGGIVVMDQLCHSSIQEGAFLSEAKTCVFRHNNMSHLEKMLQRAKRESDDILICTEGVFSADGDFGKIAEIVALAKKYGAKTYVDEAHSILLAGEKGRGVSEEQGVLDQVDYITITFSKAFGSIGGAIIADKAQINYINWFSRSRFYSCALSPSDCASALAALRLSRGEEGKERRKRLLENADYLRKRLKGYFDIYDSQSWVVPVIVKSSEILIDVGHYLKDNGIDVGLMGYPSVPAKLSRCRIFVTSEHSKKDLDELVSKLFKCGEHFGFIYSDANAA